MTTIHFPGKSGAASMSAAPQPDVENEAAIARYIDVRCVARGMNASSRRNKRLVLKRFLRLVGRAVWEVTPNDYDRYIAHHVLERELAPSTHRYYQTALDGFFSYLASDLEYQGYLQQTFGVRLVNPICDDNRIIHKATVQHARPHYALTREELEGLFSAISRLRDTYAKRTTPSSAMMALCAERNRIAFGVQYYLGLRIAELCALDVDSFEEAPWARESLGKFGLARVVGKGMAMQGPKSRMVPATTVQLRTLLEWYLAHVRPRFPAQGKALFVSTRGTRACRSTFMHVFKTYLREAGLDPAKFSTHSLRRSGITHDVERMDLAFGQLKAGHEWEATTQIYVARPSEYVQDQANRLVEQTVKAAGARNGR